MPQETSDAALAALYAGAGGTLHAAGKPAFWWARETQPWRRISAEIEAAQRQKAKQTAPAAPTEV